MEDATNHEFVCKIIPAAVWDQVLDRGQANYVRDLVIIGSLLDTIALEQAIQRLDRQLARGGAMDMTPAARLLLEHARDCRRILESQLALKQTLVEVFTE